MNEDIIRFEDLFYLLLFREEMQNKSLLRFGKSKIPEVNARVANSEFSFLRTTLEITNTFFVLQHLGKFAMEGVSTFLDTQVIVHDCPEFIIVDASVTDTFTPASLPLLVLPDIPDRHKGVIVGSQIPWFLSHLAVEYSKLADWVAVSTSQDSAVVVFSMVPEVPIGKVIEL